MRDKRVGGRAPVLKLGVPFCTPGLKAGVTYLFVAKVLIITIVLASGVDSNGQNSRFKPVDFSYPVYHLTVKKIIIPTVLIGYGFAQYAFPSLIDLNKQVRLDVTTHITKPFRIDNYSQWAPGAAVYGLNLCGIKGKHNFLDRSIILGTSLAIMEASVYGIKALTHIQRPDGSTYNAFPSGHTATAFACAEFLYQEYKDVSPWYGIAGYTIAAGTGCMRMYNNRHWLTDVVAGAGFGILSTKLAYWIFPKIKKLIFKDMQLSFSIMPSFDFRNGPVR